MTARTRTALSKLLTARNEGSAEQAGALLHEDIRYWDPENGTVTGREAVAVLLTGGGTTRLELETLAAGDDEAVAEVRVAGRGASYRSTEVYRLEAGTVAELRAYFDRAGPGT
jgi:ketosteroid isomerase-like protein